MAKFIKCTKCWREYFWYRCPNWCWDEKPKEVVQETLVKTSAIKEEKIVPEIVEAKKEPKVKQVVTKEVTNTFKWLPLYTASHLHNKLKINLNSIKNETCCIKVWDNYILHTNIITQFKEENSL